MRLSWTLVAVFLMGAAPPAGVGTALSGKISGAVECSCGPAGEIEPLQAYQVLRDGDKVKVPAGASVEVVYYGGRREKWEGPAEVKVGAAASTEAGGKSPAGAATRGDLGGQLQVLGKMLERAERERAGADEQRTAKVEGERRKPKADMSQAAKGKASEAAAAAPAVEAKVSPPADPLAGLPAEERAEIEAAVARYEVERAAAAPDDVLPELTLAVTYFSHQLEGEALRVMDQATTRCPSCTSASQVREWMLDQLNVR